MEYLLGIDIGTSGTKTVLFDKDANPVEASTREYPLYQPQNGWAEQNPEDWWEAVKFTCRAVILKSGVDPKDIKGIGLSGQMHGLVVLDEQNNVIRPSIIWCDGRTGKECDELTQKLGKKLIEITCNPALTGFTASKILWLKNNEPQNFARVKKILLPKDYIRFMLTGEYASEVSDASGMQLMDVKNRCWSKEMLDAVCITEDMLGKLYESSDITGYVTQNAANECGLAEGTIVAGGAADNAAAAVGTGVVTDGKAFTTIGTSGVVYAHSSTPCTDKQGRAHTFCSAVKGEWLMMGVTQAAGLSLKWFRDAVCTDEKEKAKLMGIDVYLLLDDMAAASPIGANRLIYLPYLMGERTPHLDPDCRGVFFGLSAMHTKGDMLRAVMEGVSYSLKDCLQVLNESGVEPKSMVACGGGGTSPLWRQMLADVYGFDVFTCTSKEGPALGVAILAGVACGMYESVQTACERLIKYNKPQPPIDGRTEKYAKLHEVYKSLYPALRDQYKKLSMLG